MSSQHSVHIERNEFTMHQVRRALSSSALLGLSLLLAASALLLACGGGEGAASAPERFKFIRGRDTLFRVDTRSGQVWRTAMTGDGGWQEHGAKPEDDGGPAAPGRYQVNSLGQRPGTIGPKSGLGLLRTDLYSGRAWLASEDAGSSWLPIAMGPESAGAVPAAAAPVPAAAPKAAAAEPDPNAIEIPAVSTEKADVSPEQAKADVEVLIQALTKEGLPASVKAWSAQELGRYDASLSVPPLLEALKSDEPELVVGAIKGLKSTGAASSIPAILKLKQHPDPRVRAAVDEVVVEVR